MKLKRISFFTAEALLIIVTIVGIIWLQVSRDFVISLTPLFLLLNMTLLTLRLRSASALPMMIVAAASIGFTSELIGVNTGILFGDYRYGSVLGPGLFGVPLLLIVLWPLVTITIWSFLQTKQRSGWVILIGALTAVAYDVLLEQFATRYDLWSWNGGIPISNYVGWLFISALIFAIFYSKRWSLPRTNLSLCIVACQISFLLIALIN